MVCITYSHRATRSPVSSSSGRVLEAAAQLDKNKTKEVSSSNMEPRKPPTPVLLSPLPLCGGRPACSRRPYVHPARVQGNRPISQARQARTVHRATEDSDGVEVLHSVPQAHSSTQCTVVCSSSFMCRTYRYGHRRTAYDDRVTYLAEIEWQAAGCGRPRVHGTRRRDIKLFASAADLSPCAGSPARLAPPCSRVDITLFARTRRRRRRRRRRRLWVHGARRSSKILDLRLVGYVQLHPLANPAFSESR